jgi:hypothetical protein
MTIRCREFAESGCPQQAGNKIPKMPLQPSVEGGFRINHGPISRVLPRFPGSAEANALQKRN